MGQGSGRKQLAHRHDLGCGYPPASTTHGPRSFDHYAQTDVHKTPAPAAGTTGYLQLGYFSLGRSTLPPTDSTPNSRLALVAAPLIFGGDITRLDDSTLNVLSNDEVIAVEQDRWASRADDAKSGDQEVSARQLEDGSLAVGLFNRNGCRPR